MACGEHAIDAVCVLMLFGIVPAPTLKPLAQFIYVHVSLPARI
jgi:hypothetical protein